MHLNNKPLVSVIIPNYNHEDYLLQRIESVLAQTYTHFEMILLDDCSTDTSPSILQEFKDHKKVSHLLINKDNSGSTFKQWFKGIALAKGALIWIAESDDYASPLFLEKTIAKFQTSFSPDVVFVGTTNVDKNNKDLGNNTRIERTHKALLENDFNLKGNAFLNYFMPDYCIIRNASAVVFKKEILTEKIKDVCTYKTIGDFYFWIQLCLENNRFSYLSEKLNFMRKHAGTVRSNPKKVAFKMKEYAKIHHHVLVHRWYDFDLVKKIVKYKIKNRNQKG